MKRDLIVLATAGAGLFMLGAAAGPSSMQAGLPSGMVSFFQNSCPSGWNAAPSAWNGRYVVMSGSQTGSTVGIALSPSENRPTGDHGHGTPVSFYGGNCPTNPTGNCVRWAEAGAGRGPRDAGGARAFNAGETIQPGTNAPYVQLRACVKS